MRFLLLALMVVFSHVAGSQSLPSDSIILKTIFGRADKGGQSFSRPHQGDEKQFSYFSSVVYKVVFKKSIELKGQKYVMIIVEAPNTTQHGHQLGYRNIYFFSPSLTKPVIRYSIIPDGEIPLGDESEFDIVDIGKNKKALISTFRSTGNHHFENGKTIELLEPSMLTYLFGVTVEYDNSAWNIPDSENVDCQARHYESKFEIINNNLEWYDIKVTRTDFSYSKGCKDLVVASRSESVFKFQNGEYIEVSIRK